MRKGPIAIPCALLLLAIMASPLMAGGKAEAGASSKEAVKLVYWMFGSPTREVDKGLPADQWYITAAIERFQKANPGITVELLVLPDDNLGDKFKAAGIAKNGPDICNLWSGAMLSDNRQFILPLDKYFNAKDLENAMSIEAAREGSRMDGALLGMPTQNQILVFFYNKALLKKAGVDVNNLPKDFNGLLGMFEKIKNAGITPLLVGDKEGYHSVFLFLTMYANLAGPSGIQNIISGKTSFRTDPDWMTALKAYQSLYARGYTNKDVASLDSMSVVTRFVSGGGAMVTDGPPHISSFYEVLKDDLGILQIPPIRPSSPFAKAVQGGAGQAFVVTSYSAHPAEAVKFMKFLISKEEQEARISVMDKGGGETCYKNISLDVFTDPYSRKLQDIARTGQVIYWLDNQMPSEVSAEFYRLAPLALSGKISAEDFTGQLDDAMQKTLKK